MYGVYGWCYGEHVCLFVAVTWEDAFRVWDSCDSATCIVDMETGEVLWD